MKLKLLKTVLVCSLFYYFICRFKLHFSSGHTSFNKSSLFILFNFIILLMLIVHKFSTTSATNETNDNRIEEFEEEFSPYQSNAIVIHEAMFNNSLSQDELVKEKSIILVEKYATEEAYYEEEEILLGIVLHKKVDTGWQRNLIREPSRNLELVVVEDFVPVMKKIVCVDNEYDKLDLDAVNQKFDEFIGIQKRKWQLDAAKQLRLAKI